MKPTTDEFAAKFGGLSHHVEQRMDGTYRCVVSDLGPNTCAAGDGATPEEAKANTRKVKYGYSLRFDFLWKKDLSEERRLEISRWFSTLTVDQLEMLADFVEAAR